MKNVGFIVVSDDGLAVFSSADTAEQCLEAQDVEEGTYPIAFDRNGCVYKLEASGVGVWKAGKVTVRPTGELDADQLRNLILDAVGSSNPAFGETTPLEELVDALGVMVG